MSDEQDLIPIEQHTIMFYGKPIIVVRLPDGRPAVVIRSFCENLQIDTAAQIARIRRTEVIAPDLVQVQVETSSAIQSMNALVLHAVPFWLAGIDSKRVQDTAIRADIVRYQREVVDVLYAWASSSRTIEAPQSLVPAEPITQPVRPAQDAPLAEWRDYYQRMAALIEWQMDVEQWRGSIESRVEGIEMLIPDILDRLPPMTITPAHQLEVRTWVKQLSDLTGKHQATIYTELYTVFNAPRYQDLLEADWDDVEKWFKSQIDRVSARKQKRQ